MQTMTIVVMTARIAPHMAYRVKIIGDKMSNINDYLKWRGDIPKNMMN